MKRLPLPGLPPILPILLLALGALFIMVMLPAGPRQAEAAAGVPPAAPTRRPMQTAGVEQAVQAAVERERERVISLVLFDTRVERTQVSDDGDWALAWLVPLDPDTGQVIPAEPGLAVLRRTNGAWETLLPHQAGWDRLVSALPDDLLPPEEKETWLAMYGEAQRLAQTAAIGGYRLPVPAGTTLALSRSILHHNPPNPSGSMHYAFDFATPWPSQMFNVHAAKAGRVMYARWSQPNGNEASPGNYLVLEDTSTNPPTYQLYLHLAQDSIPEPLRVKGTLVRRGQFIGVADDTGVSTGHHLHFQVHINPNSYWGTAVDITFDDVDINGGRPRTPTEAQSFPKYGNQGRYLYVSGNTVFNADQTPPTGDLLEPAPGGFTLREGSLEVVGFAADNDSGLASAAVIAHYDGAWNTISPEFTTSTFTHTWDLCRDGVPDGPVSLALRIRDNAGNVTTDLPGLRPFVKDYDCSTPPPAPACTPGPDEVAVFAGPVYQGACQVFGPGSYPAGSLGDLGEDQAESVWVGEATVVTLYRDSLSGRSETFTRSDPNLADNRIGSNQVSSLTVQGAGIGPAVPRQVYPAGGASFPANASISLSWTYTGYDTGFQARLWQNDTAILTSTWQTATSWTVGSLPPGSYAWEVRARNPNAETNWSLRRTFEVEDPDADQASALAAGPFPPPFSAAGDVLYLDDMENYTVTAPLWSEWNWDLTDETAHSGAVAWTYDHHEARSGYDTSGEPNAGALTTPAIDLPAGIPSYLRFWYRAVTESPGPHWDQRWVQIAPEGGQFENLYQLTDDPPDYWLQSPPIDLSPYAGQQVRIRFYFATLDGADNDYAGWQIDDVLVTTQPLPDCGAGDTGSDPAQAEPLAYGAIVQEAICPPGDIDYYQFAGLAGDRIGLAVDASSTISSSLDSYLFLLDADGASVLAENDDLEYQVIHDSFISYTLPYSGTFYVKLRAWDHPSAGGPDYSYRLRLNRSDQAPPVEFVYPQSGASVAARVPIPLSVSLGERTDEARQVDFYWFSPSLTGGEWQFIGSDRDASDGWRYDFTLPVGGPLDEHAFFARVTDLAGNTSMAVVWQISALGPHFMPFIAAD